MIQHELDHLDGILFLDLIKDPKSYGDPFWLSHALSNGVTLGEKLRDMNHEKLRGHEYVIFGFILLTGIAYFEPSLKISLEINSETVFNETLILKMF